MAYSATGRVYSALIVYLGKEMRRGIDIITVGKRCRIKITIYRRAYRVGGGLYRAVEHEAVVRAVSGLRLVAVYGINDYLPVSILVFNVFRNDKREFDTTVSHAIRSMKDYAGTVFILKRP